MKSEIKVGAITSFILMGRKHLEQLFQRPFLYFCGCRKLNYFEWNWATPFDLSSNFVGRNKVFNLCILSNNNVNAADIHTR